MSNLCDLAPHRFEYALQFRTLENAIRIGRELVIWQRFTLAYFRLNSAGDFLDIVPATPRDADEGDVQLVVGGKFSAITRGVRSCDQGWRNGKRGDDFG